MKRMLVIGGGFAGVWACAAGAALRHNTESENAVEIVLVSKDPNLVIRPRLYERNPEQVTVPLAPVAEALAYTLIIDEVVDIDLDAASVTLKSGGNLAFDTLVLAAGSRLRRPEIPGIAHHTHDVDTLDNARRFWRAVDTLDSDDTVAVIGAGFTGLELVTEVAARSACSTVLIDSRKDFSRMLSTGASDAVHTALADTRVCFGSQVVAIDAESVTLGNGEQIRANVVAWTAGMEAHPLAQKVNQETDGLGRLRTDRCLNVCGSVYAAGDVARTLPDGEHIAPMSCQYAIPTGMVAGYNAMATLTGSPRQIFERPQYVTCIDLGNAGGLLTQGWERLPVQTGEEAKGTKKAIMDMINPPADRATWFEKAIPEDIVLESDFAA